MSEFLKVAIPKAEVLRVRKQRLFNENKFMERESPDQEAERLEATRVRRREQLGAWKHRIASVLPDFLVEKIRAIRRGK